jgi:hypothetical protein
MEENHPPYFREQLPHLGGYIQGGDQHTFMPEIWTWMVNNGCSSIIDVGCGEGYSTKFFHDKGCDVIGIEGGINAYNNNAIREKIILHDYTKGAYVTKKKYDAIWCCEFVEHVEEIYTPNFLATFKCAKKIVMTYAYIGQSGYHHVNCQTEEYWIKNIEKIGFKYNKVITVFLRALSSKMHSKRLIYFEE